MAKPTTRITWPWPSKRGWNSGRRTGDWPTQRSKEVPSGFIGSASSDRFWSKLPHPRTSTTCSIVQPASPVPGISKGAILLGDALRLIHPVAPRTKVLVFGLRSGTLGTSGERVLAGRDNAPRKEIDKEEAAGLTQPQGEPDSTPLPTIYRRLPGELHEPFTFFRLARSSPAIANR